MKKRKVEVFSAGCLLCDETVRMVQDLACEDCDITVYELQAGDKESLAKAKSYGIHGVPTVVVNGEILDCCKRGEITREFLKAAGIGRPLK